MVRYSKLMIATSANIPLAFRPYRVRKEILMVLSRAEYAEEQEEFVQMSQLLPKGHHGGKGCVVV
jgi:hypothetical protein